MDKFNSQTHADDDYPVSPSEIGFGGSSHRLAGSDIIRVREEVDDEFPYGLAEEEDECGSEGAFESYSYYSESVGMEKENYPPEATSSSFVESDHDRDLSLMRPPFDYVLCEQDEPGANQPLGSDLDLNVQSSSQHHSPMLFDNRHHQSTQKSGPLDMPKLSPVWSTSSSSELEPVLKRRRIQPFDENREPKRVQNREYRATSDEKKKSNEKDLVTKHAHYEGQLLHLKKLNSAIRLTLKKDKAQLEFLEGEIRSEISLEFQDELVEKSEAVQNLERKLSVTIPAQEKDPSLNKGTVASRKSRAKRSYITADLELKVLELYVQIKQEEQIKNVLESIQVDETRNGTAAPGRQSGHVLVSPRDISLIYQ